jgi:hypothetical protein
MDWNNYKKKYEDITGEIIDSNVNPNTKKSKGINDLTNYTLITRDNVNMLEIGCHIKYVKNVFDINTNKTHEKIFNGGFLLEIANGDKMHTLDLVLKSNITWKLRFIRFKVYAKFKKDFHYENNNKAIEDHFRNENAEIIEQRKKEIDKKVQDKLKLIKSKQKKDHYVLFGKSIIINSDDEINNSNNDSSDDYDNT